MSLKSPQSFLDGSEFAHADSRQATLLVKTVLAIDDNVGFLFWLGKTLENAGYNVVPSTTIPDAIALLALLGFTPDLLIVNPALLGAGWFIDGLRSENPGLSVVAAVEEGIGDRELISVRPDRVALKPPGLSVREDATQDKTLETDAQNNLGTWEAQWLLIVRTALEGRATSAD